MTNRFDEGLKRILVGTDFSRGADAAVRRAVQIASTHGASLTVLHVCDVDPHDSGARQVASAAGEKLRERLQEFSDEKAVAARIAVGKPLAEITQLAREEDAQLVIMGARGARSLNDLLVGTTAEKVVRHGDRPVLVVKRRAPDRYRRVLVAVDFSKHSRNAFELALRLAPGAEFYVLHAYYGSEDWLWRGDFTKAEIGEYRHRMAKERREMMKRFLRDITTGGRRVRRLLRHGRPTHVIPDSARRLRADLVAVGTVGRTGLPYVLLGSVAEHVLREAPCDVLVARSAGMRDFH